MSDVEVLRKALDRERIARKQAESLLEEKSRALFDKNQELENLNVSLESLVQSRTSELALARDQAVEASRAKSQFLANMSHELRTPLNAILGYSEMLQEDAADLGVEAMLPDLKRIHGAGKHLLALINDILDLSKIEAGQMTMCVERVVLAALLQTAVETVAPTAEKNGNSLTLAIEGELGELHTDPTRLGQVVLNLLSNAVKFTQNGRITLTARSAGKTLEIEVRDTGIGIAPEVLSQLFVAFRQADASTSRKYGGTGLGLTISRHFAQLLGGDISVESALGEGSTFTLRLPRLTASSRPAPALIALGAFGQAAEVLVIDDDPYARDLFSRVLVSEGYSVRVAVDAAEGMAMARARRPSLIVLDILMPGINGWQALAALREDPELGGVPVVVASVVDGRAPSLALGAADFVSKPINRERVLAAVGRLVRPPASALVVDDDEDCRVLLGRAMSEAGYRVRTARGGNEAIVQMKHARPDLVLLDLMMPDGDGFSVLEAMQLSDELRAVPVVVVTARSLDAEERARIERHAQRVFEKGHYDLRELLGLVRTLVGGGE